MFLKSKIKLIANSIIQTLTIRSFLFCHSTYLLFVKHIIQQSHIFLKSNIILSLFYYKTPSFFIYKEIFANVYEIKMFHVKHFIVLIILSVLSHKKLTKSFFKPYLYIINCPITR